MQAQGPLMDRLMGIVTFKAPVYKEIAEDKTATQMAAIIVIVVAVIVGLISGLLGGKAFIFILIAAIITEIIGWLLGSWLLAFIAKTFFKGDTDTGEMLRVTGFTAIFRILGVIPVIGIIGGILQIIANVIAIREAAGFDTTKAILTAIIAGVIVLIVAGIITGIIVGAAVISSGALNGQ